jgi:hypothetical protein
MAALREIIVELARLLEPAVARACPRAGSRSQNLPQPFWPYFARPGLHASDAGYICSGGHKYEEDAPMANHLTPTELAREAGLERREVISKCMEMGVPIFQGRIDKALFLENLRRLAVVRQPVEA